MCHSGHFRNYASAQFLAESFHLCELVNDFLIMESVWCCRLLVIGAATHFDLFRRPNPITVILYCFCIHSHK